MNSIAAANLHTSSLGGFGRTPRGLHTTGVSAWGALGAPLAWWDCFPTALRPRSSTISFGHSTAIPQTTRFMHWVAVATLRLSSGRRRLVFRSTGALSARSCGASCDTKSRWPRGTAAAAAVRPSDAVDATRNTLLSSMEVEDKLKRLTQALKKSKRDLAYARVRNLDLLADQQGSRDAKPFSLDGAAGCNVEQHAAVMEAVCMDPATMRDHFEKVLGAKERVADAAAAMMASYHRNMVAYKRTGDARWFFWYDGACFSTAIEIFSKMSEPAYEHLRVLFKGLLPSTRRVQDVVNRHTHQPGGIRPGSIRDYAAFVSGLPRGEKWAACHRQLGIRWHDCEGWN